jgi:hypothetical protein
MAIGKQPFDQMTGDESGRSRYHGGRFGRIVRGQAFWPLAGSISVSRIGGRLPAGSRTPMEFTQKLRNSL